MSVFGCRRVMCDNKERAALPVELGQVFQDLSRVVRVEITGRLVGKEDIGLLYERSSQGHSLTFTDAELSHAVVQALGQGQALEELPGFSISDTGPGERREHDVLDRREVGDQVEQLKHKPYLLGTQAASGTRRKSVHVLAVEENAAARRANHAAHGQQQGSLTRAARAADYNELPRFDGQGHAVEGADSLAALAVDLGDLLQLDGYHSCLSTSAGSWVTAIKAGI